MRIPRTYRPFILSLAVVLADQGTKYLVIREIPENTIGAQYFGDFFRIIHVTNTAIAFSIGSGLPDFLRKVLFIIIPLVLLCIISVMMVKSRDLTALQRWAFSMIIGGGTGNLIDRIFRPGGVVDFLDVKFYGIFGLERWPTFNIGDSSIVIGGTLLIFSIFFTKEQTHEQED